MPTVKCQNCGHLGAVDPFTRDSSLADDRIRQKGDQVNSLKQSAPANLYCVMNKRRFEPGSREAVVAILTQDYECDSFTAEQFGKTPEQIRDMAILDRVQQENRRAREDDQAHNAEWRRQEGAQREEFEQSVERRHKELKDDADRRHVESLRWQEQVESNVGSRHGRTIGFNFLNTVLAAALAAGLVLFLQWLGHRVFDYPSMAP